MEGSSGDTILDAIPAYDPITGRHKYRLTTFLCKKKTAAKSKEVKIGCSNWNSQVSQDLLKKAMAQKNRRTLITTVGIQTEI
jgi:hypothetical protein